MNSPISSEASEDIEDPELKLWQLLLSTVDSITRYGYTTVPRERGPGIARASTRGLRLYNLRQWDIQMLCYVTVTCAIPNGEVVSF